MSPRWSFRDKPYAVQRCNYQHITKKNAHPQSQITSMLFFQNKLFFFFILASPLINKNNAGHLGMSKSESLPEMLQDALPYPLPVITPIWEASHSRGIRPFPDCLSSVPTFGYSHLRVGLGGGHTTTRVHPTPPKNFQILSVLMSTAAASAMVIKNVFLLWL